MPKPVKISPEPIHVMDFFEGLDAFGDPVLLAVRTDKTGSSQQVATKSGNPFHDPGSGTFGNGPAGAKVTKGGDILTKLAQPGQLYVTQIRNKTGATEIQVEVVKGRAHITMLNKAGGVVARLDLPIPQQGQAPAVDAPVGDGSKKTAPSNRDSIVERARGDQDIAKLDAAARAQRIDDLTDYLTARYNADSGAIGGNPGGVHIAAPAGWDTKTIGGLSDTELAEVSRRLAARGWTKPALNKILLPNVKADRRNKITPKATTK